MVASADIVGCRIGVFELSIFLLSPDFGSGRFSENNFDFSIIDGSEILLFIDSAI